MLMPEEAIYKEELYFPDVLAKRYGGMGEACTRGRLRSE
jgi:hypothetical protein